MKTPNGTAKNTKPAAPFKEQLFARVVGAYDLPLLRECRLVWIGVGGASACVEDLARAGVGQFVLIDPGLVEECNLATQHYYQADIGKPKVECLARKLREINPDVCVKTRAFFLNDIGDREFEDLARSPICQSAEPAQVVIIGSTDDFFAQARVNRLALQFGLPSLCCQLYYNALAGELTLTHPETTPACHRCILSRRFDAYLREDYQNTVGSAGSPICSTSRLNALTTAMVLSILHHGTDHPRWGGLLRRIGNRNLMQVRCHPDVEQELGLSNFAEALAGAASGQIFFDETIWRPQLPEHPSTGYERPCPDCGGLGDLGRCKGKFADTRVLIP